VLTKEQVLASIDKLPSEFTLDQVIDQLMLIHSVEEGRQQVEEGRQQVEAGEVVPHDEVKKQFGR